MRTPLESACHDLGPSFKASWVFLSFDRKTVSSAACVCPPWTGAKFFCWETCSPLGTERGLLCFSCGFLADRLRRAIVFSNSGGWITCLGLSLPLVLGSCIFQIVDQFFFCFNRCIGVWHPALRLQRALQDFAVDNWFSSKGKWFRGIYLSVRCLPGSSVKPRIRKSFANQPM